MVNCVEGFSLPLSRSLMVPWEVRSRAEASSLMVMPSRSRKVRNFSPNLCMSNAIVPKSEQSRKSDPASKRMKNESRVLQGFIDDTERTIEALQAWLTKLQGWQYKDKVSPQEFEEIYTIIRNAGLEDWAKMGIDELRIAVSGK